MKKLNDTSPMNDFENHLQQQPMRPVPAEWRSEILGASENAHRQPATRKPSSHLPALKAQLSAILWPCPQAWAGLGMVWLMILAVNFATQEKDEQIAQTTSRLSPETIMALREQKRELAKLIEPFNAQPGEPPKTNPSQPRSERRISVVAV
jgi:hypothetical protein